jgi:hypothetical protein
MHSMRRTPILIALCGTLLVGCVPHRDQTGVFVSTAQPGASCAVSRGGQPVATVAPTPGIALVGPRGGDVVVECRRNGFLDAAAVSHAQRREQELGDMFRGEEKYDYEPISLTLTPRS